VIFEYGIDSQVLWKDTSLNVPNKILVERKTNIETSIYLFLHELGHHELRKKWSIFKNNFPIISLEEELRLGKNKKRNTRCTQYYIECFHEEYRAWEEALILAQKLSIPVNINKFNKLKSKCLISYMKYYANKV
jgi:hypothetical protein